MQPQDSTLQLNDRPRESAQSRPETLPTTDSLPAGGQDIRFSKDSLNFPVDYTAEDSIWFDAANQKIHLYGNAQVDYTSISLNAAYLVLDYRTKIVTARGGRDSVGEPTGLPVFKDGEQEFVADSMRYNFEKRKGMVYYVTTQQNDVIVHGAKTKFVSTEDPDPRDTTVSGDDIIYSRNGFFTTCTHEEPHFGVRSTKQKIIADQLVVVGPSNLELMGVPTPLWLPFGFFPISGGRQTGLLFPRDYEYSQQWGFGIRDVGWFFPLGEHFNLSLTGNIYLKGTFGLNAYSQYKKRYKYSGRLVLGYDNRRQEDAEGRVTRRKSFRLSWTHNQDATAHPTINFGGSINLQTNGFQQTVFNDERVLQNQLNSNFNFQKSWRDLPISFSAAFNHSQNTATNNVTVNFPTLQFQTRALYPFRQENRGAGQEKWYESITMRYRGEARNRFTATDTTLFSQETLQNAQTGIQHNTTAGLSFKLFKYFNLNPSVTYDEVWYTKTRDINFIEDPVIEVDTIFNSDSTSFQVDSTVVALGKLDTNDVWGFQSFREYSTALTLNTQIFGTLQFKKGLIRGLRHVIKPSISMRFAPDYLDPERGYFQFVPTNPNEPEQLTRVSIFQNGIFGGPPATGRQFALSYSINNIFQAKVYSKKDSTEKKINLFDNFIIGGNYNFAADSLQWSQVNMSGTTRLFKGATTFRFSARFDPYTVNEAGRRINTTAWRADGQLLRFVNAQASLNSRFTVSKLRALFQGKEEEVVEEMDREDNRNGLNRRRNTGSARGRGQTGDNQQQDFLGLFDNFSINHNISFRLDGNQQQPSEFDVSINTINVQGNINLTDNWRVGLSSFGYDFARKDITFPFVNFSRDLHCWELSLGWSPRRNTYSFMLRVKPGTFDFLSIPYNRNNADARRIFD